MCVCVQVMITAMKSKKDKFEVVIEEIKVIKHWGGKKIKISFKFVCTYMTTI